MEEVQHTAAAPTSEGEEEEQGPSAAEVAAARSETAVGVGLGAFSVTKKSRTSSGGTFTCSRSAR